MEEKIKNAEVAAEPGGVELGGFEHKGSDDVPATMTLTELSSAGWVYIYDTKTGDRSLCNRNMLAPHLNKKRVDGTYVFTTTPPAIKPRGGTFRCMLHRDSSLRVYYDTLGLPVCPKDNLSSQFQVTRHMQKRHKQEWQTLEQERIDTEKREDRAFQREIINRVSGKVADNPEPEPAPPVKVRKPPGRPKGWKKKV